MTASPTPYQAIVAMPPAHPVFALWPLRLADELRRAVVDEGMRKIDAWTERYKVAHVDWPARPFDPFFNVNTPEDAAEAARIAAAYATA